MASNLQDQLQELLDHKIISEEVASSISDYYKKKDTGTSKLFVTFGVIGAILASLGIILVFAHNWDDMSRMAKSIVSFLPLVIGQALCGYSLFAKSDSATWKESSASFLFFAVGASISLVAQAYNISGDFAGFMLVWMLLCLPLVYLMQSNLVSLLYIIGITVFAVNTNYFYYSKPHNYTYWLLLLGILPHYYHLLKGNLANFRALHNWFLAASLVICLGSIGNHSVNDDLLFFSYAFLFSVFYFIGKTNYFNSAKLWTNGFAIVGKIGSLYMLYLASFKWIWSDLLTNYFDYSSVLTFATIALFACASALLLHTQKIKALKPAEILQYSFLVFGLFYVVSKLDLLLPQVFFCNGYLLFIGVREIQKGNATDSIMRLNFGVLIIAILITCRFFDTNMSFIVRGVLFIVVGLGFFGLNYYLLKKRKQDEK